MSIDKWISETKEEREKREKIDKLFKSLPEEKVLDLKKRKIKDLKKKRREESVDEIEPNSFLNELIEFKEWLNQRTYLKGDLDKIEIWIHNLNKKLTLETKDQELKTSKAHLIEQFRKIPPKFLDEKTRVAINKKLYGTKRTSSDNYYLRKLKKFIQDKLIEASYYELLKTILDS